MKRKSRPLQPFPERVGLPNLILLFIAVICFLFSGCTGGGSATSGPDSSKVATTDATKAVMAPPPAAGSSTISVSSYVANTATLTKWYAEEADGKFQRIVFDAYLNASNMQLDQNSYLISKIKTKATTGSLGFESKGDSLPATSALPTTIGFLGSNISMGNMDLTLTYLKKVLKSAPLAGDSLLFTPDIDSTDGRYHLKFNITFGRPGQPVQHMKAGMTDTSKGPMPMTPPSGSVPANPSPPAEP